MTRNRCKKCRSGAVNYAFNTFWREKTSRFRSLQPQHVIECCLRSFPTKEKQIKSIDLRSVIRKLLDMKRLSYLSPYRQPPTQMTQCSSWSGNDETKRLHTFFMFLHVKNKFKLKQIISVVIWIYSLNSYEYTDTWSCAKNEEYLIVNIIKLWK